MWDGLTKWFQEHHTVRKIVKGTILASAGLIVASQIEVITYIEATLQQTFPEWLPAWFLVKPMVIAGFVGLDNYLKHNPVLPVVGAKPSSPPPRKRKGRPPKA